jgi:hypothetical protein
LRTFQETPGRTADSIASALPFFMRIHCVLLFFSPFTLTVNADEESLSCANTSDMVRVIESNIQHSTAQRDTLNALHDRVGNVCIVVPVDNDQTHADMMLRLHMIMDLKRRQVEHEQFTPFEFELFMEHHVSFESVLDELLDKIIKETTIITILFTFTAISYPCMMNTPQRYEHYYLLFLDTCTDLITVR